MNVSLQFADGSVRLRDGANTIGRQLTSSVRIMDQWVSRTHAVIEVTANSAFIEDLRSTNGTLVNDALIAGSTKLADGDVIRIGRRVLRVHFDPDPDQTDEEQTLALTEWSEEPTPPGDVTNAQDGAAAAHRSEAAQPRSRRLTPVRLSPWNAEDAPSNTASFPEQSALPLAAHVTEQLKLEDLERRREPRYVASLRAAYASDTLTVDAVAREISSGGTYVASEVLDAPGTRCQLTLFPEQGPEMSFVGVISHVIQAQAGAVGRPPGMGIKFENLSPLHRRWLDDMIEQLEQDTEPFE